MNNMKHDKNDFEHSVVKVLKTERTDPKNRVDLRIVKWKTAKSRSLENRRIWEKDGVDLFRKMAGLSADDVQFIINNADEILRLLKEDTNA